MNWQTKSLENCQTQLYKVSKTNRIWDVYGSFWMPIDDCKNKKKHIFKPWYKEDVGEWLEKHKKHNWKILVFLANKKESTYFCKITIINGNKAKHPTCELP